MAITTEEQTTILSLVVTMFDAAPGAANLEAIVGFYEANGNDITATAAALAAGPLFTAQFDGMDNGAIADQIASNFGLEKNVFVGYDAEGQLAYDYIKAELDGGADLGTLLLTASAYLQTAEGAVALPTAAATLANKTSVSEYYSVTKGASASTLEDLMAVIADVDATDASVSAAMASIDTGYEGQTFMLTNDNDALTGTSYDDMFLSYLSQNSLSGGVSNTLSSGDVLDGGAGEDTLAAQIVPEFFGLSGDNQIDIQVKTNSIETVTFEAREVNFGDDNSIDDNSDSSVTIDAKDMVGTSTIGSKFSDGDLVIENLTTEGVAEGLSGMTITMDHTDNGDSDEDASDLTVLFDEDYLDPTLVYGEEAVDIRIMNEDAYDSNVDSSGAAKSVGAGRLDGVYIEKMIIQVHGVDIDLADYITEDPDALGNEFTTEAALVAYLNTVVFPQVAIDFAAVANIDTLIATTEGKFTSDNNRQGDIIKIAIDNPEGLDDVLVTNDSWVVLGQAASVEESFASNRYERAAEYIGTDSSSMEIDITLTKVGRDGEGGNLVIGGKDQDTGSHGEDTDVDQTDGIPTFNITVEGDDNQPSNLGRITSTNGALKEINVTSAQGSTAALTVRGESGDLDLNSNQTSTVPFGGTLETFNANTFVGDLAIGQMASAVNIDTFTATGGGDVTLYETINGTEQGVDYSVTTAGGDDKITVSLDGDAVDALTEGLTITTAAGEDTVTVTGSGDVSDETTLALDNLHINTGSGADRVNVNAEHIYRVNTESESDFVVVDANNSTTNGTTGSWTIGDGTDAPALDWADRVLYQAELTVDFAGFEQTVTITTTAANNFVATQEDINDAVIAAIAANPELSKLLSTTVGTGTEQSQQLSIVSTVQGLNDLTINVNQGLTDTTDTGDGEVVLSASHLGALQAGLIQTTANDSDATDTLLEIEGILDGLAGNLDETGAVAATDFVLDSGEDGISGSTEVDGSNNTTATSRAIIDLGTGANDLVALDSDDASADTVVFSAAWDKVSIVNFFTDQNNDTTAGVTDEQTVINHTDSTEGLHILDFTYWLDDMTDISTDTPSDTQSAVRTATTDRVDAAATLDILVENEVIIVNDFADDLADSETWDNLTASALEAVLENSATLGGDDAHGNLAAIADTVADSADDLVVGEAVDSIFLIENDSNKGEYKVFNAENADADNATEAFTVTFLGTVDFGETITAAAVFA